jgi:polar amino acid transport system substrate-binding protein
MNWHSALRLAFAGLLFGLASGSAAHAASTDEIISRGKVIIGIDVASPPWGTLDAQMKPQGYDVDVANMVAKYLGVPLEIVVVTGPSRIPSLLNNQVDMVIASPTITAPRALQVWYSNPYCVSTTQVVAPKAVQITTAADMSGKKIGVVRGNSSDTALQALAPADAQLVRFDDDAALFQAMISGQVDAIAHSNLAYKVLNEKAPDKQFENKYTLLTNYFGIMIPRGQTDLLQWLNTMLFTAQADGSLAAIYDKWVGGKMPPLPAL